MHSGKYGIRRKSFYTILLLLLLGSCRVQYDQPRVKKVNIVKHSGSFSENELETYVRQKPNKKLLFVIPFNITVHNLASHLKDRTPEKKARIDQKINKLESKQKAVDYIKMEKKRNRTFRSWLMETIGEAPVLYDSLLTQQSTRQMQLHMKTTGHFNAEVSSEIKTKRSGRTAIVTYHIFGGSPYSIDHFNWHTDDKGLKSHLEEIMKDTPVKSGTQYNEDALDNERDRITSSLRNNGFYHFSKSYITYNADTSGGDFGIDLQLIVKPFSHGTNDSTEQTITGHPRSKIGLVVFNLDFRHDGGNIHHLDTTIVAYQRHKRDSATKTFYFVHEGPMKYTPKAILKKCFLRQGDLVRISNAVKTNNGLASLGNFKYINIRFSDSRQDSLGFNILDANIDLSRIQKQTITTEIEGTNSSGKLGVSANLTYRNRNTFKGAEMFALRLRGAIEAQTLISSELDDENIIDALPFNTIETGFETELLLPRFLMPFTDRYFTERNAPKTLLTAGGLFQQRPDYTRYIGNLSITYDWRASAREHFLFTPVFLNLVRIFPDSLFSARIEQFSRPLQTSYKDHFINGFRLTYTYSNKTSSHARNHMLFRGNIENAGALPFIFSRVFAGAQQGQTYYLLGIRFAQYTKGDFDLRQYFMFNEKTSLVLRLFTGVGVPYGNIDVLPFDKRYSAGGSNDIRAWKFRSLGPGSYSDKTSFDKTGDISVVANMEYRFPIYSILHSAIFVDAGNIWMLKEYDDYPGGTFKADEFYKQIAMGAGLGFRLNFGYFIFRLDAAFPLHDPAQPDGERWLGFKRFSKRTNLNFGIGYPF
jgi:outer membrane protein assembly factor BamA